jgi:hypothetical protein
MAKPENWNKIRKNIYVPKYDPYKLDLFILEQLRQLDLQRLQLMRKLGRRTEIYVPERHPIFESGLMRVGRLTTIADCVFRGDRINEMHNIQHIEYIDDVNNLTNVVSDNVLEKLKYGGEKYKRVTAVVYDEKEILRLSCVQEKNLI